MIVPGFVFRKKNIIDEHQSDAVTSLAMNLTWPCLVIDAMQIDFSMEILKQSGYMMVVALVIFAAVAIIGVPLTKVMKLSPRKSCLTMFTLIFGNTGFIGIPVIKALYGSEALFFTAILELVNDVLMFKMCIRDRSEASRSERRERCGFSQRAKRSARKMRQQGR